MRDRELDPGRGREVANELRKLGVKGILLTAAEAGYITALACQMPDCLCPEECGGRRYFEPVQGDLSDWAPNHEHAPISKEDGGHRTVDNSLLAHNLCNRIDYSRRINRPHQKDLDRVEAARKKCVEATSDKATD